MISCVRILSALTVPVILLSACVSKNHAESKARRQPMTVTADNSGESIILSRGQQLIIRLPSNPTTGYRWSMIGPNTGVLNAESPSLYEPDRVSAEIVGAGGTEIWTLTPVKAGQDTLRFEYRRPWEKETAPAQTVSYTIKVR